MARSCDTIWGSLLLFVLLAHIGGPGRCTPQSASPRIAFSCRVSLCGRRVRGGGGLLLLLRGGGEDESIEGPKTMGSAPPVLPYPSHLEEDGPLLITDPVRK